MTGVMDKDFPCALVIQRNFSTSIPERLQMQDAPWLKKNENMKKCVSESKKYGITIFV
jgi:hypothetical protein